MLDATLVVLLSIHLLLVDVAMAGPLACVWLDWRDSRRSDDVFGRAGLRLARWSEWALTIGILLGGLLLAARWWRDDGSYFAALAAVPRSRLWFAGFELLFYFACMGAYTGLWNRWRRWRLAHRAVAVAAATNLLIHFPALFAIISVVSSRPELLGQPLSREEFQRLLLDGEVLSRVVHVWMGALAVGGVAVMELGVRLGRDEPECAGARPMIRQGAVLALAASVVQIPIGLWVTMEMPEAARGPLLGGDLVATGLFAAAVLVTLVLLHQLAAIALGDDGPKPIRRALVAVCLVVTLMVGTRARVDPGWSASQQGEPAAAVVDVNS